jgi:cyclophilin family peptidyl-prolyl cis-trans isomerase
VGTDKRERQKANRASRVAAAEDAARSTQMRSRLVTYGILALVVVAAIVGIAWLTSDSDDDPATDAADPLDELTDDPTTTEPTASTIPTIGLVDNGDTTEIDGITYGTGECPADDGSSGRAIDFSGPQPLCIDPAGAYVAVFDTNMGEIRVDLTASETPGTVNNFVTLARWGYYDDTTIFRTAPSIDIVQGGAPHTGTNSDPGPGYNIQDEPTFEETDAGLVGPYRYVPGQLVMARTPVPDGASAQYFFTTGPNAAGLDSSGTYVVFGETDGAGIALLESMLALDAGGAPSETITVNSVTIEG